MRTTNKVILCTCLLLTVGSGITSVQAVTEIVPVDLLLVPPSGDTNRAVITIDAEFDSDSDTSDLSGNILATLTIDFDTDTLHPTATALEFTGGDIQFSDVSLHLEMWLWTILLGTIDADGTNISGTLDTPFPPGPVFGNMFNTVDHEVILNDGTVTATGTGAFADINETIDLGFDPISGTTDADGTLTVTLRSVTGSVATYDVTMRLPFEVSQTDTNIMDVTISAQGMLGAVGAFSRLVSEEVACEDVLPTTDGAIVLSFASEIGLYYQVQWRSNFATDTWHDAGDPLQGTGGLMSWTDDGTATGEHPSDAPQRFYRIRKEL